MKEISDYIRTILGVFIFLSAGFILLTMIKFIINSKRKNYKSNKGMRGQYDVVNINTNEYKNKSIDKELNKLSGEKVLKYDNGDMYKGEIINGKRNGFGICIFSNKERYEGLWKDDKMHSIGKYIYNDGTTYSGDFKNGLVEGLGTYTYKNKNIYKGYFTNNKKNGKGVLYYKDGSKYTGMWEDNHQCGEGSLAKSNGDFYEGHFYKGKLNGKGEYKFKDGSRYIGEFKDNVFHGHGCHTDSEGNIYEGEYKYGMKRGYGILKFRNKEIYEGDFKDDLFEGVGRYTYYDSSIYEGDFKNGKREGVGTYTCNLYKYIGEWNQDKKGRIGSYYLSSKAILDVVIEDEKIVQGIYKVEDENNRYLFDIDISSQNEKNVLQNINYHLKNTDKIKLEAGEQ